MPDLSQVTYCGLYCGLCAQRVRIPRQARTLAASMRKEGWDQWGQETPRFKDFWAFLNWLGESEGSCNCRAGKCGPPFCGIRKCAEGRGVETCPLCDEYPCGRIAGLAKGYVMMIEDGKRLKRIGLDAWIAEQEARRETGFSYADIRCQPYDIADK
jgi:hypothetical protein